MTPAKFIIPILATTAFVIPAASIAKDKPRQDGKPAVSAQAKQKKPAKSGKPGKPVHGAQIQQTVRPPTQAAPCPPGLAKKNPPCIPPGQVKHRYSIGQSILNDYIIIKNPLLYGLDRYALYYLVGNEIYQMDRDTRKILAFVGLASALLK